MSIPDVEFCIALARDAGALIQTAFHGKKDVHFKLSSADLVTETDLAVEKMCIARIKDKFPNHKFICEESEHQHDLTDDPTWCIDPVDGTMNFVHTFPLVAVSIGFVINRRVEIGVIYNSIMDELWYAQRGKGSWVSQGNSPPRPIKVAPERSLLQSVVATGYSSQIVKQVSVPSERSKVSPDCLAAAESVTETSLANHRSLLFHCRDLRRMGSCACDMAWVAHGRVDAMAEIGVKEWDVAAGVVIIEEAGGYCCNYDGTHPVNIARRNMIGASTKKVAEELVEILQEPRIDMQIFG